MRSRYFLKNFDFWPKMGIFLKKNFERTVNDFLEKRSRINFPFVRVLGDVVKCYCQHAERDETFCKVV